MADLNGFNANDVDPVDTDFEPVPPGHYIAVITESEMKETKSGNGSYLALTFEICEGEYTHKKVWTNLNLDNPSEAAVRIAKGQLSSICRAAGVMTPSDSVELHNLPIKIKVTHKKRTDGEDGVNVNITSFTSATEQKPVKKNGKPPKKEKATKPW